jgi:hypothetical protein
LTRLSLSPLASGSDGAAGRAQLRNKRKRRQQCARTGETGGRFQSTVRLDISLIGQNTARGGDAAVVAPLRSIPNLVLSGFKHGLVISNAATGHTANVDGGAFSGA